MKEMNREMELSIDELEQVNGGAIVCFGKGEYNPEDFCTAGFGVM